MMATLIGMLLIVQVAKFLVGHLETAVAINCPNQTVWLTNLGTHGSWNRVTHGSGTTRVEPRVWSLVLDELSRPHLVLTNAGGKDGLWATELTDALRITYCGESLPSSRLAVAKRVTLARPFKKLHQSTISGFLPLRLLVNSVGKFGDYLFGVANDWNIGVIESCQFRLGRCQRESPWRPGANDLTSPVTRSSKRAPRVMRRSAFCKRSNRRNGSVHARHT